jgi:hypothetical protein
MLGSVFSKLDWSHLVAAGLGAAMTQSITLLFGTLFRSRAKALMSRYRIVKRLATVWPIKHPTYSGEWVVEWKVQSGTFPKSNVDRVTLYKFLNYISAEIGSPTANGQTINYGFVGQLTGTIFTGNWVDSRAPDDGYYGPFQLVMAPTMHSARGKWIGFSRGGLVKSGDLIWTKIQTAVD